MATIRRDVVGPGKDKKVNSSTPGGTTTTKLRVGPPTHLSKTNSSAKPIPTSTLPLKHTPTTPKKPVSTIQKPAVSRIRPSDNTTLTPPAHKPRASLTNNVPRVSSSSSVSGKTGVSQKAVPSKNVKAPVKKVVPPVKDIAKRASLSGRPVSSVNKSSSIKKKETGNSTTSASKAQQTCAVPLNTSVVQKEAERSITTAAKECSPKKVETLNTFMVQKEAEKITNIHIDKVQNLNISVVPKEAEKSITSAAKDQHIINIPQDKVENLNTSIVPKPADILETEEQIVQAGNKGTDDLGTGDQEPLNIEQQIESERDKDASNIVIADQDAPVGIKTEEVENELHIEVSSSKQVEVDEPSTNEAVRRNSDENIADNHNEEEVVEEKEVIQVQESKSDMKEEKEVVEVQQIALEKKEEKEVVQVQEIAMDKKEEEASGIEVNKSKETKVQEVVEQKKKEENIISKWKRESAVSNDVISETASKLRDQRKNRVRALAGAFETVISLQ